MSRSDAVAVVGQFCGHCGREFALGGHEDCDSRLTLEPPRFCTQCRRRMLVQVIPRSWTATCVEHGTLSSG